MASRRAAAGLAIVVIAWWLVIAAAVAQLLPAPAVSAPKGSARASAGQAARIHLPGLPDLPVPVERAAFEEYRRGVRESDEEAIDHAFAAYEWIRVSHRQAVRVTATDGEAVEVELLDGAHAGRRAWMTLRQVSS